MIPEAASPVDQVQVASRPVPTAARSAVEPGESLDRAESTVAAPGVNLRFLIVAAVIFGLLVAGVAVLHSVQVRRMASVYRERAANAAAEGDHDTASQHLRSYLRLKPDDTEARVELAWVLDKTAETPRQKFRTLMLFESILREDRGRRDVRRRVVEQMIALGRHRDAIQHLLILLQTTPNDGRLQGRLAECYEAEGEYEQAVHACWAAIRAKPNEFSNYERLARLYRDRLDRPDEAERVLNDMVAAHRAEARAYLIRARFRHSQQRHKAAVLDAEKAFALSPSDPELLTLIADLLAVGNPDGRQNGRFDPLEVRRRLEQAVQNHGDDTHLLYALSQLDMLAGQTDQACRRLKQALTRDPENLDLMWLLVNLLQSTGQLEEAQAAMRQFRQADAPEEIVAYLRARLAMKQKRWLEASRRLESIRPAVSDRPRVRLMLDVHLAECYRHVGHAPRRLRTFRRAVETNGLSAEARLGLAKALAETGQTEEALLHYRQVMHHPGVPLSVARLLIERNARLPAEQRDWDEVEQILEATAGRPGDRPAALSLRADMLVIRDQPAEAERLLQEAVRRYPERPQLVSALARIQIERGAFAEAEKTLQTAQAQLGGRLEIALAWLEFWSRQEGERAVGEVQRLLERTSGLSTEQTSLLLRTGAAAYERLGSSEPALQTWRRAAETEPDDLTGWRSLAEAALRAKAPSRLESALAQIRRIEGGQGPYSSLYEAGRLILLAEAGDRDRLPRTRELLSAAAKKLAGSPKVPLMRATVQEMQGNLDAALDQYQLAIQRGERNTEVVKRTLRLMYRRREFLAAQQLIEQLRDESPVAFTGELGQLATAVALRAHNGALAGKLVGEAVSPDSQNPRERLWLAQIRWATGDREDAEKHFRAAVRLDPSRPESRVALVYFLARTGRDEEAAKALRSAAEELGERGRELALAQCYEAMGETASAERHYLAALQGDSADARVLWMVADFHMRRGKLREAEPLLRRILDPETKATGTLAARARRGLALVLLVGGGYPGYREGMRLIEQNLAVAGGTADDLRIKAKLLASRPRRRPRLEAIRVLNSLDEQFAFTAADQFQMIRLYLATDDWENARPALHGLLAGHDDNPQYLAFGIRAMLDHRETGGIVRQWLKQLERLQPQSEQTVQLRIWMLAENNQVQPAVELCRQWVGAIGDAPAAVGERKRRAAALLADLAARFGESGRSVAADRLAGEAESLLRDLLQDRPEESWRLAQLLVQQWRFEEAFRVCESAWDTAPPEKLAGVCVALLARHGAEAEQHQRVRGWIEAALQADPDSAELTLQLANVCHLAGEYDRAIAFYRKALQLAPQAVLPHNELALLLALHGGRGEEALRLINRAIERLAGPLPYLLDTRATVYLSLERPRAALRDLEQAVADSPSPARYFHMAQTHTALGNRASARTAYLQAVAEGLDASRLHRLEEPAYRRLTDQLAEF